MEGERLVLLEAVLVLQLPPMGLVCAAHNNSYWTPGHSFHVDIGWQYFRMGAGSQVCTVRWPVLLPNDG